MWKATALIVAVNVLGWLSMAHMLGELAERPVSLSDEDKVFIFQTTDRFAAAHICLVARVESGMPVQMALNNCMQLADYAAELLPPPLAARAMHVSDRE